MVVPHRLEQLRVLVLAAEHVRVGEHDVDALVVVTLAARQTLRVPLRRHRLFHLVALQRYTFKLASRPAKNNLFHRFRLESGVGLLRLRRCLLTWFDWLSARLAFEHLKEAFDQHCLLADLLPQLGHLCQHLAAEVAIEFNVGGALD